MLTVALKKRIYILMYSAALYYIIYTYHIIYLFSMYVCVCEFDGRRPQQPQDNRPNGYLFVVPNCSKHQHNIIDSL